MSTLTTSKVQVGQSATPSQNFVLRNNNDGTFRISRGNLGAESGDVLTVNADGTVTGSIIAGLGVGQTRQDVTGSRAAGVTYTNTTGRTIYVKIVVSGAGLLSANLVVGGVNADTAVDNNSAPVATASVSYPVIAGQTYSLTLTQGSIVFWSELRA